MIYKRLIITSLLLVSFGLYKHALAGIYVGGSIGAAAIDNTSSGVTTSATANRLYIGYEYIDKTPIADYRGYELGFVDYGKHNAVHIRAKTFHFTIGKKLSPHVDLHARLGAVLWESDNQQTGQLDSSTNLGVGAGFRFRLTPRLGLLLEYDQNFRVGRALTGNNNDSLNVQWLGLNYHF